MSSGQVVRMLAKVTGLLFWKKKNQWVDFHEKGLSLGCGKMVDYEQIQNVIMKEISFFL